MLSQSEKHTADSVDSNADQHHSPAPLSRQLSLPRLSVQSSLLRMGMPLEQTALLELQAALPPLLQALDWSLKYRLSQAGASLGTLLRQSGMSAPVLIIAKVREAHVLFVVSTTQCRVLALAVRQLCPVLDWSHP